MPVKKSGHALGHELAGVLVLLLGQVVAPGHRRAVVVDHCPHVPQPEQAAGILGARGFTIGQTRRWDDQGQH